MALSHISIHTRHKSGGRRIIRRRNDYPRQVAQKFEKNFEKNSQYQKLSLSAENTLFHILILFKTFPYTLHDLNTLPNYALT